MLSPDKSVLLQSFLGTLPKDMATRLASAVELDRLTDGNVLPHDVILDSLRPALRADDAHKRTPTPLRLFCRPFEDLLANAPRDTKQKGRILRSYVVPIWHWVSKILIPKEAQAYSSQIRNFVLVRKYDESLSCALQFWPVAGEAMIKALANDRAKAESDLGDEAIAADAEDAAQVLKIGSAALAVQALLPKPTPSLTDGLLYGLRQIYDQVATDNIDSAPYISVIALRRLAKPWEALKLALLVSRQKHDAMISSTDMGLAGDVLFGDMEDARVAIMAMRPTAFDPNALIAHLTEFTNISTAIVKEVEITRSGRWGQRLLKDRAAVGNVMDGFMERAPKEIIAALPTHKAGYTGGPKVPDLTRQPDQDRVERAKRYARVLAGTKPLAVPGSFGVKHQNAVEQAALFLRSYTEDVLKEVRSEDGERRELAQSQFLLALELACHVYDENEAELLRRRGKAAGVPIAA